MRSGRHWATLISNAIAPPFSSPGCKGLEGGQEPTQVPFTSNPRGASSLAGRGGSGLLRPGKPADGAVPLLQSMATACPAASPGTLALLPCPDPLHMYWTAKSFLHPGFGSPSARRLTRNLHRSCPSQSTLTLGPALPGTGCRSYCRYVALCTLISEASTGAAIQQARMPGVLIIPASENRRRVARATRSIPLRGMMQNAPVRCFGMGAYFQTTPKTRPSGARR